MTAEIIHGDCLEAMRAIEADSIDAIVTDPPYGLSKEPDMAEVLRHWLAGDKYEHGGGGFMGKTWDSFVPGPEYWREAYRILRPGGYLLAFAGTRTWDLMSMAIRLGGFVNRDTVRHDFGPPVLGWAHGQGFPKGKAQLKPAWEPILMFRKPGPLRHLRIDECRINPGERVPGGGNGKGNHRYGDSGNYSSERPIVEPHTAGRWPANFVMSHSQYACYTLREDVPRGVADAIHAYYGAQQTVPALRQGLPGHAVGPEEAEVLRQGVRGRQSQGGQEDGVGDDRVRAVRDAVSGHSGVGQERPAQVLLRGMPDEGAAPAGPNGEAAHGRGAGDDESEGHRALRRSAVVSVEGRALPGLGGLRDGDGLAPTGDNAGTGPQRPTETRGLYPGASGSGGGDAGAAPDEGRDRPPRQRRQGGQPAGEPDGGTTGGPQRQPSGDGQGVACAAAGGGSPARRERRLAVPLEAIPEGWLRYFEYSHAEGCERVGTKRVKGAGWRDHDTAPSTGPVYGDDKRDRTGPHYGGADGTEEVPAYRCAEGCPVALMDEQSGVSKAKLKVNAADTIGPAHEGYQRPGASCYTHKKAGQIRSYEGEGGASRFFHCFEADPFVYQAKASKSDRTAGGTVANGHPTVKSTALMRHLIRLVAAPGDLVCDPFAGSGSTGVAALAEGMRFIGIEQDAESVETARRRCAPPVSEVPQAAPGQLALGV